MSLSGLFMGEDTLVGGDDEMAELSGGQNAIGPLLEVSEGEVITGRDDSTFVDSADEFDDDFLGSVIIDDLKLSNISVDLHELEESDDEFGSRSDLDLLLSLPFGVDDSPEAVSQHVHFDHWRIKII